MMACLTLPRAAWKRKAPMRSPNDLIKSSLDTYSRWNVVNKLFFEDHHICFCGLDFAINLHNHQCSTVAHLSQISGSSELQCFQLLAHLVSHTWHPFPKT